MTRSAALASFRPVCRLASFNVSEQVFPSGDWAVDDDRATDLVADRLELLMEILSWPDHDWSELEFQARGLHEVTRLMADRYHGRGAPCQ